MTTPINDERTERSRRYPGVPVRDAILYLEAIHRGLGLAGGSREGLAQALGHGSLNGASKRKVASLIQYGLVDRDGERYRISDIGRRILIPISEREKIEAIAEAVRHPALFQEIGTSYDQQALPSMLPNVLAREHGVLPQASSDVATTFVQSVEQAGLLVGGILNWTVSSRAAAPTQVIHPPESARESLTSWHTSAGERPEARSSGPVQEYSIPLDNRGRRALINLPTPVAARDLDRLIAWVGYMRSIIDEVTDQRDGANE